VSFAGYGLFGVMTLRVLLPDIVLAIGGFAFVECSSRSESVFRIVAIEFRAVVIESQAVVIGRRCGVLVAIHTS